MNKYQEALLELGEYTVVLSWSKNLTCSINELNEFKLLQELVDRATPKKVVNKHPFKSFGWCPSCNCSISRRHYPKFCGCGQALDWSE